MQTRAAAFDLPGDDRGVLCIHGFTGTPYEMGHLGRRLHQRGFTVVGPVLPGHGTTPEHLDRTGWADWYEGVLEAFDDLRRRCTRVAVVGQSLGGLLALHLAADRGPELSAVAALATPLWLGRLPEAVLRLTAEGAPLGERVPILPKLGGSDVRDRTARRDNPCYRSFPVRALHQLRELMTIVDGELPEVSVPALVVHARQDHTAPFACARHLRDRLGSATVRERWLDESYHLVAIDVERDVVAAEVGVFFETAGGMR